MLDLVESRWVILLLVAPLDQRRNIDTGTSRLERKILPIELKGFDFHCLGKTRNLGQLFINDVAAQKPFWSRPNDQKQRHGLDLAWGGIQDIRVEYSLFDTHQLTDFGI